jgi:hypothetical protein
VYKLESEIKQLEESRRQFALDYNWYQLAVNGASLDELNRDQTGFLGQSNVNGDDSKDVESSGGGGGGSTTKAKSSNSSPVALQSYGTPYIVYSLHDFEILEDLYSIKLQSMK